MLLNAYTHMLKDVMKAEQFTKFITRPKRRL